MNKIQISGGRPLYGDIEIGGMKNAALPIIFATILAGDVCTIENLPLISDVVTSLEILESLGARVTHLKKGTVRIDTTGLPYTVPDFDLVRKLRGSIYIAGAQLGRFGQTEVGLPGGCDIGNRPIDQHQQGFAAMGAETVIEGGRFHAKAPEGGLRGTSMFFNTSSVGTTINMILAAVLADGLTVIENAAREPHIVDVSGFLNACGAHITGAGTPVIRIHGVKKLHGCDYAIIPDMIEAGTYMVAAAAAGGQVTVRNVIPKHLETVTAKLREMGVGVEEHDESVTVSSNRILRPVAIKTLPYPGFPTDMQPQFGALMTLADGVSMVSETVFSGRFRYADELTKMGAVIKVDGGCAVITGVEKLTGAPLRANDLRAGAALVIAALAAEGVSVIEGTEYIERGYENIVAKLKNLGAEINVLTPPDNDNYLRTAN